MSEFIYLDIASELRGRISRGEFGKGRLPSERHLTGEFGVQRATVRRALKALEREGLVFRDTTRGTYATPATPSPVGRNMERGGVALIIGRTDDTTAPGDVARGLSHAMKDAGRFVVWFDKPSETGHAEALAPAPEELMDRGVAAMVLWPQVPANLETLRAVRDAMPLTLIDRRITGFESDYVGIDDYRAGRLVTEHLLGLGHTRIGFLAVAPQVGTVQARCRGWMAALADAGIVPQPEWVLHRQGDNIDAIIDAPSLDLLLKGGKESPSAIVCSNDTVAAVLIRYLHRAGRRVPDDVAVTGFGNSFPHLLDALRLTTIAQPWEEMGKTAGEILLERLQAEHSTSAYREIELPVTLVVRGSCGAAVDL